MEEIMSMKSGEIKKLLLEKRVNTKGVFEKAELAQLLFASSSSSSSRALEIPMFNVPFYGNKMPFAQPDSGEVSSKSFIGIDVTIKGKPYRMVVDTGASMNLMKVSAAKDAQLEDTVVNTNTIGMGGTARIAASACVLDQAILDSAPSPATVRDIQFAILNNGNALPESSTGLLGLTFLAKLGMVEFDFSAQKLRFGMKSLDDDTSYARVPMRNIFTGLIVADALFAGTPVIGLVDLGSTYTILNSMAVSLISKGAIDSLDKLPSSTLRVAGIDGNPVTLRRFIVPEGVAIGKFAIRSPISVYAADIDGLASIGLGPGIPCCILGMDVLGGGRAGAQRSGRLAFDFRGNWMYLNARS